MIGDLTAAIALHHRNIARHQQMFGLAGLALGENGVMLYQPDFVAAVAVTAIGELMHGIGDGLPVALAELTNKKRIC